MCYDYAHPIQDILIVLYYAETISCMAKHLQEFLLQWIPALPSPKWHKLPIPLFLKCTIFAAYNHRSPNMYLIIAKVGK